MSGKACYLSELITKLQEILTEHGDMKVWVSGEMDEPLSLDEREGFLGVKDNDLRAYTRDWSDTHTEKILYI